MPRQQMIKRMGNGRSNNRNSSPPDIMEHDDAPLTPQQLTSAENNTQQLTIWHIKAAVVLSAETSTDSGDILCSIFSILASEKG